MSIRFNSNEIRIALRTYIFDPFSKDDSGITLGLGGASNQRLGDVPASNFMDHTSCAREDDRNVARLKINQKNDSGTNYE